MPEPENVALVQLEPVEVDVLHDEPAVLDHQRIQPDELLDRLGPQLRLRGEPVPELVVAGEVLEDVAERSPGGVQTGRHQRHADQQ